MRPLPDDSEPDLGATICPPSHGHRIHALGGGMFVCFKCFVRLFAGKSKR